MADPKEEQVTLNTVHEDLQAGFAGLKGEVQGGFASLSTQVQTGFTDLKATLVSGFRSLPTRESSEEMVRLLREGNRLQEERLAQLDVRLREQHLEIQQVLRAMAEGIGSLTAEVRTLSADIKALIARLDALIKGRGDGAPSP